MLTKELTQADVTIATRGSSEAGGTAEEAQVFRIGDVFVYNRNSLDLYEKLPSPNVIVSDGAYGVSGFKWDAKGVDELTQWYLDHVRYWSLCSRPGTTLWFWNTEIGWAKVHSLLDEHGWEYMGCNIWNKGIQHIAGNCNLPALKTFPVVTEVCVHYVRRAEFRVGSKVLGLKEWLRYEWERTGIPLYKANQACGVASAATRKYLAKDHLWYPPPPDLFEKIVHYANKYGLQSGAPYFSFDGKTPATKSEYERLFHTFKGKYGVTNVWNHPPLHGKERVRQLGSTKYAHLNQKPISLIKLIIEVSSEPEDVIWEPFGGLCTAGLVAYQTGRKAFCAEVDPLVFEVAVKRLRQFARNLP